MQTLNVLFLCTHNSCRSVIAECIMNALGGERFCGLSAGSSPSGTVNVEALAMLEAHGYDISGVRSKSWDEFAKPGAPPVNFIFTVCDDAADEVCPIWPGKPISAHWGVADPSRLSGSEADRKQAFETTHQILRQKIEDFLALPFDDLDELGLKEKLSALGHSQLCADTTS